MCKKLLSGLHSPPALPASLSPYSAPTRDLFLKGRHAETQGLGIGAFTYYRRIVEGQKNRLIDEVIRVARRLKANDAMIAKLESAKTERQFDKAIQSLKKAIPPALFIKGHNPLTLLHGALSEGMHAQTDEDCLAAANKIRLILIEFTNSLSDAMKDQQELDAALSSLVNRPRTKPRSKKKRAAKHADKHAANNSAAV